jgi:sec-independent protein translocase protein TatA
MAGLSYGEMLVILVVGLVLFGPGKIPEFARQCGKAVNSFKRGLQEGLEEVETAPAAPSKSVAIEGGRERG